MGPISIPYYESGAGSEAAANPLDIENEDEWQQTFDGYIVFNLQSDNYDIVGHSSLKKIDKSLHGYVPFDHGSSKLRLAFGLLQMCGKWNNKNDIPYFQTIINSLSSQVKK